jgi:hypothetical protein
MNTRTLSGSLPARPGPRRPDESGRGTQESVRYGRRV